MADDDSPRDEPNHKSEEDPQTASETITISKQLDIGVLFHEHATTLFALLNALTPVIESLGPNPFESGEPSIEELEQLLDGPVSDLTRDLGRLIEEIQPTHAQRGLTEDVWNSLIKCHNQLLGYRERIAQAPLRPPFLRDQVARWLINSINEMRGVKLPQERVKAVIQHAKNVERIVCLYDLSLAKSRIVSMDHQVQMLRDYLTASARPKLPRRVISLRHLIAQVIAGLTSFATERRVRLELRPSTFARVEVVEADVRRALSSILHNAIKYSWRMHGDEKAWVDISCRKADGYALIEFANWGVPIKPDEIRDGLIFQMGYRGVLSGDGGRLGTGIGLHDAKQVAVEHGGDVIVSSALPRNAAKDESYKRAYITTVTFKLPISDSGS
jgi:signal transduction histidine kinase